MKQVLLRQYRNIVNKAAQQLKGIRMPKEGWIRTTREALGMSGAQLARRIGVTRARISQAEIKELSDTQKAGKLLETSGVHIAQECQSLSNEQSQYELDRLREELLKEMPSDLWDEA